jgi:hypothetical protein
MHLGGGPKSLKNVLAKATTHVDRYGLIPQLMVVFF